MKNVINYLKERLTSLNYLNTTTCDETRKLKPTIDEYNKAIVILESKEIIKTYLTRSNDNLNKLTKLLSKKPTIKRGILVAFNIGKIVTYLDRIEKLIDGEPKG